MSPIVETFNFYLAVLGIVSFLTAAFLFVDQKREQALKTYILKYGLIAALIVSGGASVMSLVYSDVFGFVPCGLCWLERIFLYPQVVLLLTALYFKDTRIARYGIVLSALGIIIALYHHYLQLGGTEFVKCPAAGAVDCAKRIMFEFDFMTFPLLAASGFALLIAIYYYMVRAQGTNR